MKRKNLFVFVIMSICLFSSCIIEGGYYSNLEDNTVYEIRTPESLQNFLNDTKKVKAKIYDNIESTKAFTLGLKNNENSNKKLPNKEIDINGYNICATYQVFIIYEGCSLSIWNSYVNTEYYDFSNSTLFNESVNNPVIENKGTLDITTGIKLYSYYGGILNSGKIQNLNCNIYITGDVNYIYDDDERIYCLYNDTNGVIKNINCFNMDVDIDNSDVSWCYVVYNAGLIDNIKKGEFQIYNEKVNTNPLNFNGLYNDGTINDINSSVSFIAGNSSNLGENVNNKIIKNCNSETFIPRLKKY